MMERPGFSVAADGACELFYDTLQIRLTGGGSYGTKCRGFTNCSVQGTHVPVNPQIHLPPVRNVARDTERESTALDNVLWSFGYVRYE